MIRKDKIIMMIMLMVKNDNDNDNDGVDGPGTFLAQSTYFFQFGWQEWYSWQDDKMTKWQDDKITRMIMLMTRWCWWPEW